MANKIRIRVFSSLAIVLILSVIAIGFWTTYSVDKTVRGAYAVWWVADMCIEHMEANDGKWPENWDELRDDYQTCVDRSGQPWTFDELASQVEMDWDANPIELVPLADDSAVELRVIWLSNGSDAHWAGREPNQKIVDYLKSLSKQDLDVPGSYN